jgi:uncharacterized membrane protein
MYLSAQIMDRLADPGSTGAMTNHDTWTRGLTLASAVGAGLSAGVFFGFSTFVMRALGTLPARQGLSAMQAINKAAPNPLFMVVLFGTAATGTAVAVLSVRHLDEPGAVWTVVGAGAYLVAIAITAGYHVPHNDALALVAPDGAAAAGAWQAYRAPWTLWNHMRTLTSGVAAVCFTLAARAAT